MLVSCLATLAVAGVSIVLSLNTTEEIVKVAMAGVAGLCLILSLIFAPWPVKALVLAAPLALDRLPGLGAIGIR
ncbi:hypothetical protein [Baaleninema sp.]|uniref:hypothetical protein n=1 Tax=Baaleninema sp. TaxID=3101197 RepID=UPI003D04BA2C